MNLSQQGSSSFFLSSFPMYTLNVCLPSVLARSLPVLHASILRRLLGTGGTAAPVFTSTIYTASRERGKGALKTGYSWHIATRNKKELWK